MPEPVLSVDGLVRRFGDLVAVDDVSFRIEEGETYGLLGPNGAGKTTAISVVAGLLSCDGGEIRLGGQRVGPKQVAVKAMTGLVPSGAGHLPRPDRPGEPQLLWPAGEAEGSRAEATHRRGARGDRPGRSGR
jgi:ABC-type molybdenum transport system ATPase subunit/photorepair protein PhrA